MFPVSSDKEQALRDRLEALGITEADLQETFVRSGGKGGQNVNKVATCVVLVHLPSGRSVKCQEDRSQAMNRFLARRLLADKIEAERLGKASREAQRVAKIQRQKRRRSRRAKEKILQDKHHRADVKAQRGPVRDRSSE